MTDYSGWVEAYGSSYANPLIAGMGVLMKEKCGGSIDQRYLRAQLMGAAWYYDPEDSSEGGLAFSTQPKFDEPGSMSDPGFINDQQPNVYGNDYRDGAGGPIGGNALIGCSSSGGRITFDGGPLTLSSSGGSSFSLPEGSGTGYNITLPGEGGPGGDDVNVLSYDATNLKTAWERVYTLAADTRLRAVLVWDKCTPTAASGPGSGPYNLQNPTDDYDLVLCPTSGGSCAALSRSVYDNKEGFDVRIANAGNYRLSVLYDEDASIGCNGSYSVAGAFALYYASPSSEFVEAP